MITTHRIGVATTFRVYWGVIPLVTHANGRTLAIPALTPHGLDVWQAGALVQQALPDLTEDEREFLLTGLTAEEWDALFAEDDHLYDPQGDDR